jgi:heme-degrading monooxygenase HmoA
MIARTWRGRATAQHAQAYERHFTDNVLPELKDLAGNRGNWLLRRNLDGEVEFVALTLWDSRDSIKAFAGGDIAKAHIEPQARAVLASFDEHADHYEVAVSPSS